MTGNQRVVLRWLEEHSDTSGIILCSNSKIAETFGWSQPYAQKILSFLVGNGYLEELRKGTGHRPTRYQVSSLSSHNLSSHSQPTPLPLGRGGAASAKPNKRESVFGSAPTRIVDDDERLLFPPSRRTNREGPMKKFRKVWDQTGRWGPQEIVCYYRWLYHTRYGIMPVVDWPMCCGTARALLKRLGSPKSVKRYLQLAFALMRFKPQGLNSLYHSTMYEQVRQHWEADEDFYDDYVDDWVFPWCKEIMRQESHRLQQEYDKRLVLAAFSPRHIAMVEKQRKEKRMKLMLQSMKDNWELYSEYRRK